jgi:hypothetical protein
VQIKDAIQVRAFGQLGVGVSDPQRLAGYVNVQDKDLSEMARNRLRDMAVQALQAALGKCATLSFPDCEGACTPECVERVTADVSADLHAQLADMGLELRAFVIESCLYEHGRGAASPIDGGEDSPGTHAIRRQLGLETPSQSPTAGLGYAPELGAELLTKLGLDGGQAEDDADH